jgi:hypothetical protein
MNIPYILQVLQLVYPVVKEKALENGSESDLQVLVELDCLISDLEYEMEGDE